MDVAKQLFVKGLNDDKEWVSPVLNALIECGSKGIVIRYICIDVSQCGFKRIPSHLHVLAKQISSDIIAQVNDVLCTDFATLFFGCLDTELFKVHLLLRKSFQGEIISVCFSFRIVQHQIGIPVLHAPTWKRSLKNAQLCMPYCNILLFELLLLYCCTYKFKQLYKISAFIQK